MRSGAVAVIPLTMWLTGLWNWFVRRILKSLELQTRKVLECYRYSLITILVGLWKIRIPREMRMEAYITRFQRGTELYQEWGMGLLMLHSSKKKISFILCTSKHLNEANFRIHGLIWRHFHGMFRRKCPLQCLSRTFCKWPMCFMMSFGFC